MSDFDIRNGVLLKYAGNDSRVVIPIGVTGIGDYAFKNCSSLTSIVIPEGVTSIGFSAFKNCSSLTRIVIPEGVTSIDDYTFSDCSRLKKIVIPESVTSIGRGAFERCDKLKNIAIPKGVTGIRDMAFFDCCSLTSIELPECVTGIGNYAFSHCGSLTSVVIPEGVTSIGESAFLNCSSLTRIVIPASVAVIEEFAFYGCESLSHITTNIKLTSKMVGQTERIEPITTNDIGNLPNNMKPFAVVGFAENPDDVKSARGKSHVKYIKSNAAKLVDFALEYPCLLQFMIENKLLTPEIAEMYFNSAQAAGKTEAVAMLLDYQQHKLTAGEKQKAAEKAEAREEKITEFIFDTENLEQLQGKVFVVTGKLKTFVSRDEFKACLDACGAVLSETLNEKTGYLITNTPDSGSAKNKKAEQLGIKKLTEEEFNRLIGRAQQ